MNYNNINWDDAVKNTLADYEQSKVTSNYEKKEVDLTKYFTLTLPDGVNTGEATIRILPINEKGDWYEVVKFHNLKVGSKWAKLYDPAQDGEESPLNDMHKILISAGDEDSKKAASSYKSREFYIVKVIDRAKEHEGVKFWRFPKVGDGSGAMDKIQPLMKRMNEKTPGSGAFQRPDSKGRDLMMNLLRDTKKKYIKVSQIMVEDPSPLNADEKIATTWLNDPITWKDVYRKKPVDYLRVVAQGKEPVWDKENKTFVAKADEYSQAPQARAEFSEPSSDAGASEESPEAFQVETQIDDLPF
jgi:hypothetical protein